MNAPLVRPHVTHEELCEMLPEGTLCELVNGEVYMTPSPNLRLVLQANRSILQDVVRGVPDLVVEALSPSTARRDRGLKMEAYARHGVGECWIVSDEAQTVEVHRLDSSAGAYRLVETCRPGGRATTPRLPALSLDVEGALHLG